MATQKYQGFMALREYMLEGNRITPLEAILYFGVLAPNAEFTRMKKAGFLIKDAKVSMAKVLRRINEKMVCRPPKGLPYVEIQMTEYWVSK